MAQTVDPKNGSGISQTGPWSADNGDVDPSRIQGSGWTPVQSEGEICLPDEKSSPSAVAESSDSSFCSAETVTTPDSGFRPASSPLFSPRLHQNDRSPGENQNEALVSQARRLASRGFLDELNEYGEFVVLSSSPTGGAEIELTPQFESLPDEEKIAVLVAVTRHGFLAENRALLAGAKASGDRNLELFFRGKVELLQGNTPAARLAMLDFKNQTNWIDDPELVSQARAEGIAVSDFAEMRDEVRGILRAQTLESIDRLQNSSEALTAQRLQRTELNLYDEQTGAANRSFLTHLGQFISRGDADTLEEAVAFMQSEHRRLQQQFREGSVIRDGWIVPLAYRAARFGTPEWQAERRVANDYLRSYAQNPGSAAPASVRSFRLEGGTLDLTRSRDLPEALRVEIGPEGGFIKAGDMTYTFPPDENERVIAIQRNSVLTRSLREGRDFQRNPHLGARGVGRVQTDYTGGHPDTFEPFLGESGHWTNISLRDPDFKILFDMETRAGQERMRTPETRRRYLLEVAQQVRHRNGSYQVAGAILEELFQAPLQKALSEIPDGQVDDRVMGLAFKKMEAWHGSGRLRREDPIADQAWEIYESMQDPLNEWWHLSDEGVNETVDFFAENAVVMIPTMGAGAALQGYLGSTRLAVALGRGGGRLGYQLLGRLGPRAAMAGLRAGAVAGRGAMPLMTRGLFDGVVSTAGMTIFGHQFDAASAGSNVAMMLIFHGLGKGWGRAAQLMKAGRTLATAGHVATAGLGDAGLSYLHDHGDSTFGERFVAGMGKMAFFSGVGRAVAPMEHAFVRLESGSVPGRATFRPIADVEARAQRISAGPPPERVARLRDRLIRERGLSEADATTAAEQWRQRVIERAQRMQAGRTRIYDTNLPPRPETAHLDRATVDHHGRFAQEKNATMQALDQMEAALQAARSDPQSVLRALDDAALMRAAGGDPLIAAAMKRLNIREATTDNLADGAWSIWVARNQAQVLRDPALRALIREATTFEDFTAFGTNYNRRAPGVVLQAALFRRYNQILTRHGIRGSDRFSPAQAPEVMADALRAIDGLVAGPRVGRVRQQEAREFWREVDRAVWDLKHKALMNEPSVDRTVVFYDLSKVGQHPTLTQWLAVPLAHDLGLQVTVAPMPPATTGNQSVPRSLMFVAIPNGRSLPTGKGLLSVVDRMNAAEAARAQELGLQPNTWFGKDNVILPNPQNGGTLLTPTEVSAILRNPENGLLGEAVRPDPDVTRPLSEGARERQRRLTSRLGSEPAAERPLPLNVRLQSELDAGALLDFYGDPIVREALGVLSQQEGVWGDQARSFQAGLSELRTRIDQYTALENEYVKTRHPETREEMARLGEAIDSQTEALRNSPYNRLALAYADRVAEIQSELLPLDLALAEESVEAQAGARESGGTPDMNYTIRVRPLSEFRGHLDDGLAAVPPEEMVRVDVEVADWTAAERVANRLRTAEGVAVEHNNDLASPEAGFTGKDVLVQMESGMPVRVAVRVKAPAESRPAREEMRDPVRRRPSQKVRASRPGHDRRVGPRRTIEQEPGDRRVRYLQGDNGRKNAEAEYLVQEVKRRLWERYGREVDDHTVRKRIHQIMAGEGYKAEGPTAGRNGNVPRELWESLIEDVVTEYIPIEDGVVEGVLVASERILSQIDMVVGEGVHHRKNQALLATLGETRVREIEASLRMELQRRLGDYCERTREEGLHNEATPEEMPDYLINQFWSQSRAFVMNYIVALREGQGASLDSSSQSAAE